MLGEESGVKKAFKAETAAPILPTAFMNFSRALRRIEFDQAFWLHNSTMQCLPIARIALHTRYNILRADKIIPIFKEVIVASPVAQILKLVPN